MLTPRTNAPRWRFLTANIDRVRNRSYAGLMNLQVPPELEAKLTRLAAETGRTVDQVAVDLLTTSMDHEEWFRTEVDKGRIAAREGRLLDHEMLLLGSIIEEPEPEIHRKAILRRASC
jgi:predicted transcriptional regulator